MSIYQNYSKLKGTFIYLPEDWIKELKKIAADQNTSFSEVLRKSLRHYFNLDHIIR